MHTQGLSGVRSALNRQALRSLYLGNGPLRPSAHSSNNHHYTEYTRCTLKFNTTSRSQLGRGDPALLIIGLPASREPQERSLVCDTS